MTRTLTPICPSWRLSPAAPTRAGVGARTRRLNDEDALEALYTLRNELEVRCCEGGGVSAEYGHVKLRMAAW